MYYYIFDIKKCKKRSLVTDIKNYLSTLGISGEFAYPSAAYTTEELVDLGLSKKYNTIVGIGGDEIANKIAAKLCGNSAALGLIPLEASSDLEDLIGAKNWKEAAENLRFRKINEIKIGKTANGCAFLTNLTLDLKMPTEVTIEFKDFLVQAKASSLTISNFNPAVEKIGPDYLDLVLESVDPREPAFLTKISSFFGGKKNENMNMSLFRGRSLRLFTNSQVPLVAGGEAIAKTPQLIETSDDNLRLIVGKKSLYKCQE
jgi:diacylglycerol kinase family enzyme